MHVFGLRRKHTFPGDPEPFLSYAAGVFFTLHVFIQHFAFVHSLLFISGSPPQCVGHSRLLSEPGCVRDFFPLLPGCLFIRVI